MRKAAVGILLVGYVFVIFALPAFGIDLLIDAVGFLLIFNAARALRRTEPAFAFAPWVALALVVVSALQLFLSGAALVALAILRGLGEGLLLGLLARGFGRMLAAEGKPRAAVLARAGLLLCAAAALGWGVYTCWGLLRLPA